MADHVYFYVLRNCIYISHVHRRDQHNHRLNNDLVLSGLLLLLAKDIDVPARRVGNVRDVVAAAVLAELRDLGNLLGRELDLLEVLGDPRWRDGLGDDRVAAGLGPVEDDLGRGDGLSEAGGGLLGDGLDLGVGD